jgi:hypothetical protein
MKPFKIILFLFVLIGITAFSCDKEKNISKIDPCSKPYVIIESLNDASGVIGFNKSDEQYFISKYVEGTIDGVYILYPCVLSEEFKKDNLKVKFSGELFTSDELPKPAIGGQQIFHININKIILINK